MLLFFVAWRNEIDLFLLRVRNELCLTNSEKRGNGTVNEIGPFFAVEE